MKIPLKYQSTEYDCVPTTFINALNYTLEREKIDPVMIKTVMDYTLDKFDDYGGIGKGGTSKLAVKLLVGWLDNYSRYNNLGIRCEFVEGKDIDLVNNQLIENSIKEGGVLLSCVCLEPTIYHYVLVTGVDDNKVYFFDPYSIEGQYENQHIRIIKDKPFDMNRAVSKERFNCNENIYYSLGKKDAREGILITKDV